MLVGGWIYTSMQNQLYICIAYCVSVRIHTLKGEYTAAHELVATSFRHRRMKYSTNMHWHWLSFGHGKYLRKKIIQNELNHKVNRTFSISFFFFLCSRRRRSARRRRATWRWLWWFWWEFGQSSCKCKAIHIFYANFTGFSFDYQKNPNDR